MDGAEQLNWRFGAFELDPSVPAEGVPWAEYLEEKYGPDAVAGMSESLRRAAAADGLPLLGLDEVRHRPNTFLAHRLLAGALEEREDEKGELVHQELQRRLGLGLLSAYWGRGEDIGDREVLERLAAAAGMPPARVVAAFEDDLAATAVRLDERRAARLGIRAVPTFMFGRRFAVSGAQRAEALADAVRRGLTGA
ncbi:MAG: DsbA family oxidoreductase [Actinobacteria bacterium]|nr:DsbA family oxidoreductase [Actinomycetota bacterium]